MSRIAFILLIGCTLSCKAGLTQKGTGEVLSTTAFEEKLKSLAEEKKDFQLLDIRTPAELEETGIIEGAISMDFFDEDFNQQLETLDKNIPTLVYCRSGGRSGKTRSILIDLGFKQVYDLKGGMNGWKASGRQTVAP